MKIKNLLPIPLVLSACALLFADDLSYFTSPLASDLKPSVNQAQVEAIQNPDLRAAAMQMLRGQYSKAYRVQSMPAMHDPQLLGQELGIGAGYSQYQGVTGVILREGENLLLVQGLPAGAVVSLLVPDWLRKPADEQNPTKDPQGWGLHKKEVSLKNGINHVVLEKEGLAYIRYYAVDAAPLQLHFVNAKVNGYFDARKQSNADWDALLDQAQYPIMDAVGEHIQVAYPVVGFIKHCRGRGVELVSRYDKMIQAQYDLMGWTKYGRIPTNKLMARVNFNYYMFRDGDGVAYMGGPQGYAMGMVANPDSVIKGDPCWGFNHEVGHAHQLGPYFCWGGLGEVSNNVFSMYATMAMGNTSLLAEQGTYAVAREKIIEKGISYLQCEDVFCRLVPFWQLHLYFTSQGRADFYPDLFERFRAQLQGQQGAGWAQRGENPAELQLHFIKEVCRIGQTDMTDFFEQWGFFALGEWAVEDYGVFAYTMTAEMVAACKADIAAMQLPQPKYDPTSCEDGITEYPQH